MDDVIKEFLIECHENLDLFDRDLVILESDPASRETLAEIFRTIHTIKGASGFLALTKLEAIAHAGENLLSELRDGKLVINPPITTALLKTGDAIRRIIAQIEENGQEGNEDDAELIASLARLRENNPPPSAATIPAPPPAATPAPAPTPSASETKPSGEATGPRTQNVSDSTIRVDVALLDRLMNLAGELVLARNQILQTSSSDPAFVAAAQHLNLITTELQAGVMKTRMQPIGNIWGKFPRVVRDLAQACGKHVRLEMSGEETELDRTIIEAIKDPLTHLLRNAIDHGIETPAARAEHGKPEEGRISLRAFHENGQVNIEMADDGAGLDLERIRKKAEENGLITAETARRMSERESTALIFRDGFSTSDKVSSISGRGVGMDVVKTNIEKIGGTVEVESKPGLGTAFNIKIPLTLAIIPALIVKCGGDRYAIPQVSLIELVRLDGGKAIEHIHGAPVHRLRGDLLPLVHLNRELQVESSGSSAIDVVVLQAGPQRFGLVVDEVCDTEEIVVKPLGKQLKAIPCFAGATIMGDGTVALILDVFGLAQRCGVLGAANGNAMTTGVESVSGAADDRQTLLLFDLSEAQRMAIPLFAVTRLEEFPASTVERSGGREVVQYRGNILPLVRIASFLPGKNDAASTEGPLQTVVYNENGRSIGLVVGRIRDIVREQVCVEHTAENPWILGTAVIQNRVTDLVDVHAILQTGASTVLQEPKS